jgi:NADPH:quinone reductase-like Zn-dependent oxidoreductase
MRAAVIRETGPIDVIKVETDYPVPELKPGMALVRNQYSGINFIDTYHRSGLYARELPFIGGQEGGGLIAATTPEAEAAVRPSHLTSHRRQPPPIDALNIAAPHALSILPSHACT